MATHALVLDDTQLFELAHAIQSEFVNLQKHILTNPHGVHQAVTRRERESRDALGKVFDQIMRLKPDWAGQFQREAFVSARSQAEAEQA